MKITTSFLSFAIFFFLSFLPVLAGEIITHKAQVSDFPGIVILRAYVPVNENNTDRYVSFEWGESMDMPFQTGIKTVSPYFSSTSNYYYKLSDLKPDGTYYFRLLVEEEDGHVWQGPIQSFVTVTRTFYKPAPSSLSTSGQTPPGNTSNTVKQTASVSGSYVSNLSSSGENTSGNTDSTGLKNTNQNFWTALFGSTDSSSNTTLTSQTAPKEGQAKSFYQNILSFAKWAVLALVIFLTTALFVYAASLYERIKEAKKKNKEEENLPTTPANLPR